MASVIWILSVVLYAEFMCAVSADRLFSLDCQDENHGVHGKESLLKCFLNSGGRNETVLRASWWQPGGKRPLIMFINNKVLEPEDARFSFKQLQMSGSSIDVSFLVRETLWTDEGKYECEVATDSGEAKAVVSLSVTATYSKPDMSSVPEKYLQERVEVTAPGKVEGDSTAQTGSTAIAVVSVIIGFLLCVLLILALLRRRRTQREAGATRGGSCWRSHGGNGRRGTRAEEHLEGGFPAGAEGYVLSTPGDVAGPRQPSGPGGNLTGGTVEGPSAPIQSSVHVRTTPVPDQRQGSRTPEDTSSQVASSFS
ncbi:uncharacterized protein LOC118221550 isoform X1 [Anguilla anguilla]|uniref:uncharacterized protein LOC118221550 isoform X1 n=1 Tax=Anguilla anguilla TaxID=7936 RepID=UPI0015AB88D1|nr:uncharacterized protein LOC118221550 isoform X1 [Anguilla anguilla]